MLASWLRLLLLFELGGYALLLGLRQWLGWSVWAVLLLSLLLALGLRLSPVAFSYLYAWLHQGFYRAAGARPVSWKAVAAEMGMALVLSWQQAFPRQAAAPAPQRGADPGEFMPLLLIHGYGCNRAYWWWLQPRLQAAGCKVATVDLEPVFGDIDGYAERISQAVNQLYRTTGQRVLLVGHSMGGLACLAYLRRYGEDHVSRLITLGTPLRGTDTAIFGIGRNVEQMRRGSGWLQELWRFFDAWPLQTALICYYSVQDPLILPAEQATIAGVEHRLLPAHGHLQMGCSLQVLQALLHAARRSMDAADSADTEIGTES